MTDSFFFMSPRSAVPLKRASLLPELRLGLATFAAACSSAMPTSHTPLCRGAAGVCTPSQAFLPSFKFDHLSRSISSNSLPLFTPNHYAQAFSPPYDLFLFSVFSRGGVLYGLSSPWTNLFTFFSFSLLGVVFYIRPSFPPLPSHGANRVLVTHTTLCNRDSFHHHKRAVCFFPLFYRLPSPPPFS